MLPLDRATAAFRGNSFPPKMNHGAHKGVRTGPHLQALLRDPLSMITSAIVKIVDHCARHRWAVIIAGLAVLVGATVFDLARLSITTDVKNLISQTLPWHQRQIQLSDAFPQGGISAVVKAPTAENAERATDDLAQALAKNSKLSPSVGQPESGDFFERNGLLFASPAEVKQNAEGLAGARPLLSGLAADPSLRGIMKTLSFAAQGVEAGKTKLDQLAWPLS